MDTKKLKNVYGLNTYDAQTINHYKGPMCGDQVIFADGSTWTIRQYDRIDEYGLYNNENFNYYHTAIGLHKSLVDFCAAINEQGRLIAGLVAWQKAAR